MRNIKKLVFGITLFLLLSLETFAAIDVNNSFSPANIYPTQTSKLTVKLFNSDLSQATDVNFTNILPENVYISDTPNIINTCVGAPTTNNTASGGTITLSNGVIPAGDGTNPGTCEITVDVYSTKKGTYINTIKAGEVSGTVNGNQLSNTQDTKGTLVVMIENITGSMSLFFSGTNIGAYYIQGYEYGVINIVLNNPNPIELTGLSFSYYTSFYRVIPGTQKTTCGGNFSFTDRNHNYSGLVFDSYNINFSGGILPSRVLNNPGKCVISYNVEPSRRATSVGVGVQTSSTIPINSISTNEGAINSNSIFVSDGIGIGILLNKTFSPQSIDLNITNTTTLNLEFRNYNTQPIDNFNISDNLPSSLNGQMTFDSVVSNTCSGSVTSSSGGTVVSLNTTSGSI